MGYNTQQEQARRRRTRNLAEDIKTARHDWEEAVERRGSKSRVAKNRRAYYDSLVLCAARRADSAWRGGRRRRRP